MAWPASNVAQAFPLEMPRGLFPVPDFIHSAQGKGRIAMAAYAFDAVRDTGRHIVVVRGWEAEIDAQVLGPVGIPLEREYSLLRSRVPTVKSPATAMRPCNVWACGRMRAMW